MPPGASIFDASKVEAEAITRARFARQGGCAGKIPAAAFGHLFYFAHPA